MNDTASPQTPEAPPTLVPDATGILHRPDCPAVKDHAVDCHPCCDLTCDHPAALLDALEALKEDPTGDPVADAQDALTWTTQYAAWETLRGRFEEIYGETLNLTNCDDAVRVYDYAAELAGCLLDEDDDEDAQAVRLLTTTPTKEN